MQDDEIQARIFKFMNLDSFYLLFAIIFFVFIVNTKSYLDMLYFVLVTVNYIRIKIHKRSDA
ncbi:MAG: hypothetical protein HFJ12_00225 [Bacilli bacterium]|nr:hypothetical protein [Bacilli bacterium]